MYFDKNFKNDKFFQYLLVLIFFLLPISVFLTNTLLLLVVLLWFFSGELKKKFEIIFSNKLAQFSTLFFGVYLFGMIWTDDFNSGLKMLKKMSDFIILLPILVTLTRKQNIHIYINSFLLSILMILIVSFLVWFNLIEPVYKANSLNPTPTMSHVTHNVFIAFASYLVAYKILFQAFPRIKFEKIFLYFFLIALLLDSFITAGRAGQILLIFLMILIVFQYFHPRKIIPTIIISIVIPSILFLAYNFSYIFASRVNDVVRYMNNPIETINSIPQRVQFLKVSFDLIKDNPLFGVGTGDFNNEYSEYHDRSDAKYIKTTSNPHNMYLLVTAQLGLLGLVALLMLFFHQINFALKSVGFFNHFGVALPLGFLLIMLGESYLLGHFTTTFFILFSSAIFKNYDSA